METSAADIHRHVKLYVMIGATLLALTVLTVLVSYLHLPLRMAITIALAIATIKGSMVAMVFMHLKWERRDIFRILMLTGVFLAALFGLPYWNNHVQVRHGGPIWVQAPAAHGAAEH